MRSLHEVVLKKCLTERLFVPFILNSLHALYIIRPLYSQSDHFLGKEMRELCWKRYRESFKELAVAYTVRVCVSLLIRTDSYKVSLPEDFPFSQCSRPTANNREEIHIDWRQLTQRHDRSSH